MAARVTGVAHARLARPTGPLFDAPATSIDAAALDAIVANANLQAIPAQQPARYGLAVRRASLRTFPTSQRVVLQQGRYRPGPVPGKRAVSCDAGRHRPCEPRRAWWFVVTPTYAAWVPKSAIAEGTRSQVLDYSTSAPRAWSPARP